MKRINNYLTQKNTIHSLTKPIMILARCFGVFPCSGLMSKSPSNLRSTFMSPYTIFILLGVLGQITMSTLSLINLFESGLSPRTFQKFVTNNAGIGCTILVLKLGIHWQDFVKTVSAIEETVSKFGQKKINVKCNAAAALVFSLAILEFILSIRFYARFTEACFQGNSLMESYYMYTTPAAAAKIPFTVASFLVTQMVLVQIIFVSNFADVLIIIVSMYLSVYFEELNDLVILYKEKSPNIWNVLRSHYTKLTRLVRIVDDHVSPFILFSFGINMTTICIQLFKILRKDLAHATGNNCDQEKLHDTLESLDRSVYFSFSIIFLIFRAALTAILATRVHSNARAPLSVLYEVPSNCYNSETRRFLEQINANTIALSGHHFFYVTRGMILTMVATLITYELVLLQFSTYHKK